MSYGIVCTTDFSDSSKEALKWSIDLAKKLNTRLTILHTYRLQNEKDEAIALKRKMDEDASRNFATLETELLNGTGVEYDFKTEIGFVDDRIEEHLKDNQISFVVMAKGMSLRNKETFDDMVKELQIPLVIIP